VRDQCASGFDRLLAPYDRDSLRRHPGTVIALDSDHRLAYLNAAWDRFAEENGGQPAIGRDWGLGAGYFDAIAEPLGAFYRDLIRRTTEEADPSHPVSHVYECPAPRMMRRFQMNLYPLGSGEGVLLVHSLVVEAPHGSDRAPHDANPDVYEDAEGIVRQCAHCRKVRHTTEADRWDWVPAWVARPPQQTSHTICDVCFAHYYRES